MEGSTMSLAVDSWRKILSQRTHGTVRNLSSTLLALLATGQNPYVVVTGHNPYLLRSRRLYSAYIVTA